MRKPPAMHFSIRPDHGVAACGYRTSRLVRHHRQVTCERCKGTYDFKYYQLPVRFVQHRDGGLDRRI